MLLYNTMLRSNYYNANTKLYEIDNEKAFGAITSIQRNVITAEIPVGLAYGEIVKIGSNQLLGEVLRLDGSGAVIQLFGHPKGLQVGDIVTRTNQPLSVELGPGLLGSLCDGLQRSYERMSAGGNIFFDENDFDTHVLDKQKLWEFEPQNFKVGDRIGGGDIFGKVYETPQLSHWIMLPPNHQGVIDYIAPTGYYTLLEHVLVVDLLGVKTNFTMVQRWPVRQPRRSQSSERVPINNRCCPLYTGLRVIDALFPLGIGSTSTIVGGFASGKATICKSIAQNSNSDIVIYVGSGKRGNEFAQDRPSVMPTNKNKTHTIVAMSDSCVAVQEAAGYTGITTAEYFRDQGFDATMILDSLSGWLDASRTTNTRMCDFPTEYPSFLPSRVASFFERAGKVNCIGGPARTGSVTLVTTVRPPGGDTGDVVASAAINSAKAFFYANKKLVQLKRFPAICTLISANRTAIELDTDVVVLQRKIKAILQMEDDLTEIILLVGEVALEESHKLALQLAKIIKESFLEQDVFTKYDRECPWYKTFWMMKNIITFYTLASKVVAICTMHHLASIMSEIMYKLRKMKYEDPAEGEEVIVGRMKKLHKEIIEAFSYHS